MQWGSKRTVILGLALGIFLAGAALENRYDFLDAAGRGIAAVTHSPHTPVVLVGLLAFAGAVFVFRLAVIRIIAFRRWRAFCKRPQYVVTNRRQIEGL